MMTGFFVRLMLPCLSFFMVVTGAIQAQVYDYYHLRDLLVSKNCPAPCFMGIRPGMTTADEAITILDAHEWVGQISVDTESARGVTFVKWAWSGNQPAEFDSETGGLLTSAFNRARNVQIVSNLQIRTTLPVGYGYLALGYVPYADTGLSGISGEIYILAVYAEHALAISAKVRCPMTRYKFWAAPMTVEYTTVLRQIEAISRQGFLC